MARNLDFGSVEALEVAASVRPLITAVTELRVGDTRDNATLVETVRDAANRIAGDWNAVAYALIHLACAASVAVTFATGHRMGFDGLDDIDSREVFDDLESLMLYLAAQSTIA